MSRLYIGWTILTVLGCSAGGAGTAGRDLPASSTNNSSTAATGPQSNTTESQGTATQTQTGNGVVFNVTGETSQPQTSTNETTVTAQTTQTSATMPSSGQAQQVSTATVTQPTSTDTGELFIDQADEPLLGPGEPVEPPSDEDCDNVLDVTYRDFEASHIDMEMDFAGDVVRRELLAPTLNDEGKPDFLDSVGCPWLEGDPLACDNWDASGVVIHSADSFHDWYHTVDGVNIEFNKQLELTETGAGTGVFVYDSTAFFPLGPDEGYGIAPTPNHDLGQNFLFTTEIHLLFTYVAGQTFTFRGDDDLWIFINDKIALDLGSMHAAAEGTIDFDAQAAALGISPGGTYRMDVFHAERHDRESNFRIETNIGCFTPAPPRIK